jgi:hypothetical protein
MEDNQATGSLKEVAIYVLWLAAGFTVGSVLLFAGAFLLFNTKRVDPNIGGLIFWPVVFIVTYLRLKKTNKTFEDIWLKFTLNSIFPDLLYGLLLGAIFISLTFALLMISNNIVFLKLPFDTALAIALFAGFFSYLLQTGMEELIFRGYLLRVLSIKNELTGVFLTAALFSVAHFWQGLNLLGWLNIFLFGFLAAQLVFIKKNLWLPIGFHLAWNYFQKLIYGFPVYGKSNQGVLRVVSFDNVLLSGGRYGPEASVIITILLSVSITVIYLASKKRLDEKVLVNTTSLKA